MKFSDRSRPGKLNCWQIFHESEHHEIQREGEKPSQKTARSLSMSDDDDDLDKDTLGKKVTEL